MGGVSSEAGGSFVQWNHEGRSVPPVRQSEPNPAAGVIGRLFEVAILGLVASGFFAVLGSGYLDPPTAAGAGAAILVRALLLATGRSFRIPGRWMTALAILYIGFYPLDYLFLSGDFLTATVHLVLFLAAVKILSAATDRDYAFLILVAFLEIVAASLLSASLNYFVFLALFLVFGIATLAAWEVRRAAASGRTVVAGAHHFARRLSAFAVVVAAGALLIAAGLFFVLPRTARAAFEHLVPERFHLTAFSSEVTLGEIGEIKRSDTPLMHVRIPGARGPVHLKWRGMALGEFDGRRWYNSSLEGEALRVQSGLLQLADDDQRRRQGPRLNYEVQLKSFASDTLFIAGRPEFIRIDAPSLIRTPEDSYRLRYRRSGVIRYGVYSYLGDPVPGAAFSLKQRERYLSLPPLDPRIAPLARRATAGAPDDYSRARALEQYLRASFGYTLDAPETPPADPLADFLFNRRRGHCEYFASAMAVMLRTLGIPSRVVTGFQSGAYNPISGWQVIRASDAHSWVEAWIPGRGWVTFDPTPPDPNPPAAGFLSRLALLLDAADTFWQGWVLEYDLNRQLFLASRLRHSGRLFSAGWLDGAGSGWESLKTGARDFFERFGFLLVEAVLTAGVIGWIVRRGLGWRRRRLRRQRLEQGCAHASDATRLYLRALALLERKGFRRPPWLTASEFARHLPQGGVAEAFRSFAAEYERLRFGGRPEAGKRLMRSYLELEKLLKGAG